MDGGHHAVAHHVNAGIQALYGRVVFVRGAQQTFALNQHFVVAFHYGIEVIVGQANVGGDDIILTGFALNVFFQVIDQADLYLVFCVGTFIAGLFASSLGGIGCNIDYACPLLEAGQLAFGGTQFGIDDANAFVNKFGSFGGYLVFVVVAFFVIEFHQFVQEIGTASYLAVSKGEQSDGGKFVVGFYRKPIPEGGRSSVRGSNGSLNQFRNGLDFLLGRVCL
ncbi:unknown [Bacteroides sp. CAG:875]|nr:unknown [Bacteroides sp. CAG:875]